MWDNSAKDRNAVGSSEELAIGGMSATRGGECESSSSNNDDVNKRNAC